MAIDGPVVSRRGWLAGAVLLGLGAAGCATRVTGDGSPAGATGAGATSVPSTGASGTRLVETSRGPVEVPVEPQRIVCGHIYPFLSLLDVEVKTVVGVGETASVHRLLPAYAQAYEALPKVGSAEQPLLEQIAALEPDLIVTIDAGDQFDATYEKLGAVAPTVSYDVQVAGDWQEVATLAADAVGRVDELNDLRASYDERTAQLADTYAGVLEQTRWTLAAGAPGLTCRVYSGQSWAGVVLADAGVRFAGVSDETTGTLTTLSVGELGELDDADVILVPANHAGQLMPHTQALITQPTWANLPAAKDGVHPESNFFTYHYGQAQSLLDSVEDVLAAL